jgi:hypothetical protein
MRIWMIVLALNYSSWALLCLAVARHHRQHFGAEASPRRARLLRLSGWLATLAAWVISVRWRGWDIGSVDWCASWMLTAIAWVLLQPYRPRFARALAFVGGVASVFALIFFSSPTLF